MVEPLSPLIVVIDTANCCAEMIRRFRYCDMNISGNHVGGFRSDANKEAPTSVSRPCALPFKPHARVSEWDVDTAPVPDATSCQAISDLTRFGLLEGLLQVRKGRASGINGHDADASTLPP